MGIEKQGSPKGGKYVGGFLQMFEWNAKSRKKLFSSKLDIPEQSKLKKRCDGNLPMTQLEILDEDENAAGSSSIRESSDFSCALSVVDEDSCGTQAPGVVARLMGLDFLPISHITDPYSAPHSDSQSLRDAYYQTETQSHVVSSRDASDSSEVELKYQKVIHKPIEKFRAEVLPPKSARSIPITHHKLLSPIKSANFVPSKDAAQIMEVAARIIKPGPNQVSAKLKLHTVRSSSVPLKIWDLKEKVQAAQKQPKLFKGSQRKADSCAAKNLERHSTKPESEQFSVGVMKNKGKSISLALQAKANVQKREGISLNSSRRLESLKELCEVSPKFKQLFKDEPMMTQQSRVKKQCTQNRSSVLRQNNQKQNCTIGRRKSASMCSLKGVRESASARQTSSSKVSGCSRVSSRNLGSDIKDDASEISSSTTGRTTCKKWSIDGKCHSDTSKPTCGIQTNKNGKAVQSGRVTNRQQDQGSGGTGTDVISFTFTAPMMRLCPDNSAEAGENSKIVSLDSENVMSPLNLDGSKFAFPLYDVKGGDALSILLEEKLNKLTLKVEFSQQKSGTVLDNVEHGLETVTSSIMHDEIMIEDKVLKDNQVLEDGSNISRARKLLDCRLPSPVLVFEPFSFGSNCNSSDTTDSSSSSEGSKQPLLGSYSLKTFVSVEGDAELSNSASSTSARTVTKMQEMSAAMLDYVKEIVYNIETMFMDFALGRANKVINPHIFNWLGDRKCRSKVARLNQRLMYDCVYECLETRCAQYTCGGFESWTKGALMVRRKDRLAKEVCKEISDWSAVGDSMIDELVDQDMSNRDGKWLEFDIEMFEIGVQIESHILNSLVDEIVADMLLL